MLKIADKAPDFTLPRDGGGTITLSALRPGKVVVYFYPKDDTSGCTLESIDFTKQLPTFTAAGATIIGISKDSVKSHDKFATKYALGVILASDENGTTCEDWGVWAEKTKFGKTFWGIARTTFVVAGDGTLAAVFEKVKVEGHVDAVLAAVRAVK